MSDKQKSEMQKRNLRTGLILASIAAVFFLGFVTKYVWLKG
jgi:hypothetical protein